MSAIINTIYVFSLSGFIHYLKLNKKVNWVKSCFATCDTVKQSTTTHVVNYKNSIIVIKNVPCEECEQCGEKYYTDEVAEQLEKMVNLAKQMMQEIAVLDYSKVA